MKTVYKDVLLEPHVPCPECGRTMMFVDQTTVFCSFDDCPCALIQYRVVNRPRVDLIACGAMCYRPHDGIFVKDEFKRLFWGK